MKKQLLCGMLMLTQVAVAGVSSNFGLMSDYIWRGVTQSDNNAAVQGGIDYDHSSGLQIGTWMSTVSTDLGNEVDFYVNYGFEINENISLNFGAIRYHYTKSEASETDELSIGGSLWMFDWSSSRSTNYFAAETGAWYHSLSTSFDIDKEDGVALGLAIGNTSLDDQDKAGYTSYMDYKVSLDRTVKEYTVSVFYTATDRKNIDSNGDESNAEDKVYGMSVGRSF